MAAPGTRGQRLRNYNYCFAAVGGIRRMYVEAELLALKKTCFMKTTKEKVLEEFPELREKVVTRMQPVGRSGFCKLKKYLQIWDGDNLICEETSTKRAYSVARSRLRSR